MITSWNSEAATGICITLIFAFLGLTAVAQPGPFALEPGPEPKRVVSPSGRYELEFKRENCIDQLVLHDKTELTHTTLVRYSMSLTGIAAFSKDDEYLAYSWGGASSGVVTTVMKRNDDAGFDKVALVDSFDCWNLAAAAKALPDGASEAHLYAHPVAWEGHDLTVRLTGDFSSPGSRQKKFEPFLFTYDPVKKLLRLISSKNAEAITPLQPD